MVGQIAGSPCSEELATIPPLGKDRDEQEVKMARVFGEIPDYPPGSEFPNRSSLSESGVHRPPQAGISGGEREGADSIVVSGGYEDDEDYGDYIVYTGHVGTTHRPESR